MERQDTGLAFIQKYDNIAWYDNGEVRILDRRIYPAKKVFVICKTHVEVMQAIRDMVTQSTGPYIAAPMGMALAAWECRDMSADKQMEYLRAAAACLSNARPTTRKRLILVTDACLVAAKKALEEGKRVDIAIRDHVVEFTNVRYSKLQVADYQRIRCH